MHDPAGQPSPTALDVVVIGAGQAGLSASWFLTRAEVAHVLLDAADAPGGAWRLRWPTLLMSTVNGVHDLPGQPLGEVDPQAPASRVVAGYFADYEERWQLPVVRPVRVDAVRRAGTSDGALLVSGRTPTGRRTWQARAVLNATGTWSRPFWPTYPGRASFAGRQLHTADYTGPDAFSGSRVVVIGGGISAVQLLTEVAAVAEGTVWVTRRPPQFRDVPFDEDAGRRAVAAVAERVAAGLPPASVVSVTGLGWTPAVRQAAAAGVLVPWPIMDRVVEDGIVWNDPVGPGGARHASADVLLWCTGFRAALDHLAPLHLRTAAGGVRVSGSRVVAQPNLWLLGYGPSASTVGASRAARQAVREARALLAGA